MTGTREDAEDVVQQNVSEGLTHLGKFEEGSSFSTWLTRIGINEALMLLRKRRGLREVFVDDLSGNREPQPCPRSPIQVRIPKLLIYSETGRKFLSSSLDKLSHRTRMAIQLRELAGGRPRRPLESWEFPLARSKPEYFMGNGGCARN
jgi:RNA polymerase sigma-70 factor (ECF subfamily)